MSVRSCFVVSSNGQSQLPYHYAQSQPQLSHSFSQPFISRMSNSADHLSSMSQINAEYENNATLPFHEHVKNSAAHKFGQKSVKNVTADSNSDVNVIGTAVRIQVRSFSNTASIYGTCWIELFCPVNQVFPNQLSLTKSPLK